MISQNDYSYVQTRIYVQAVWFVVESHILLSPELKHIPNIEKSKICVVQAAD